MVLKADVCVARLVLSWVLRLLIAVPPAVLICEMLVLAAVCTLLVDVASCVTTAATDVVYWATTAVTDRFC